MSEPSTDTGLARPREDLAEFRERSIVEQLLLVVITLLGIGLTVTTIYFAYERPVVRAQFAIGFFGAGLALYYLYTAFQKIESPGDANPPRVLVEFTPWLLSRVVPERMAGRLSTRTSRLRNGAARRIPTRLSRRLPDSPWTLLRVLDGTLCVVLAIAAAGSGAYVFANYFWILNTGIVLGFRPLDFQVGWVAIILTIDATRRAYGWSIALVAVASIVYAYHGPLMPGFLQHPGLSLDQISNFGAVNIRQGTFGFIMKVGATWVAIFIMFAGLARAYGALDFILGLGQKLGENLKSGVVHIAVVSSMAMGSITGSAAANTATTGSFTIPMMKRQGVRKDYAAAIESVASSGGQIMPPVMGVAAFLMADILGVSYVRVIQAALIPAILFYFSVGVAVQLAVLRYGWTAERSSEHSLAESLFDVGVLVKTGYALLGGLTFVVARGLAETVTVGRTTLFELPTFGLTPLGAALVTVVVMLAVRLLHALLATRTVVDAVRDVFRAILKFLDGGHFGVPMLVLVYTLVVMRLSPMSAGLYTIGALILTMVARDLIVLFVTALFPDLVSYAPQRSLGATGDPEAPSGSSHWSEAVIVRTIYNTLIGFRRGAVDMAPLVGVLAAMGVIIAMVTQTGLTGKISTTMVSLGGGILLVVLLLAMVTSILFGLGMPTPAAYILVATLLAPAVELLGVVQITAHLFVFYFAMLSAITPPVAVGVAVGSRIADSGFMLTAMQALKIGAAGFLIPYALVANDSLVNWTLTGTPLAIYCVFVGVVALTTVTIGYDGRTVLGPVRRTAYLALASTAMYAPAVGLYIGPRMATMVQVAAATIALAGLMLSNLGRLPRAFGPTPESGER